MNNIQDIRTALSIRYKEVTHDFWKTKWGHIGLYTEDNYLNAIHGIRFVIRYYIGRKLELHIL